ncbi:MAG: hypothetical protein ACF8PN_08105 [Phycisphaerales bacterium]
MRIVMSVRHDLVDGARQALADYTGNPADADALSAPVAVATPGPYTIGCMCNWNLAGTYDDAELTEHVATMLGLDPSQVATRDTLDQVSLVDLGAVTFNADVHSIDEILDEYGLYLIDSGPDGDIPWPDPIPIQSQAQGRNK